MRHYISLIFTVFLAFQTQTSLAQFDGELFGQDNPFSAEVKLVEEGTVVEVKFSVPETTYLYAHTVEVSAEGAALKALEELKGKEKDDPFTGEKTEVFDHNFTARYAVQSASTTAVKVVVKYQGCGPEICYPPQTEKTDVTLPESLISAEASKTTATVEIKEAPKVSAPPESEGLVELLSKFRVTRSSVGYQKPDKFLTFLDDALTGRESEDTSLAGRLAAASGLMLIVFILIGGLLLNLTPCVLPMIPINIGIIGAGAKAGSRGRGFALGGVYGLGIALVYGILGLVVVLGLGQFGAINSSPWFNFGIAILFVVLALAMFDVIMIDFSRFRKPGSAPSGSGHFIGVFVMGCVSALLAGACVAPVLIAVLLRSATLHEAGDVTGLLLPFCLGLGMALPWPFAGAGLSFLPKPGAWMNRVKYGFGVLILLFACYYGYLGWSIISNRLSPEASTELIAEQEKATEAGWYTSVEAGLTESRRTGKPVFLDFWATWCKNCLTMEKTTFKDEKVMEKLNGFVKIKVQTEEFNAPGQSLTTREYLTKKGHEPKGLPTYVVLNL